MKPIQIARLVLPLALALPLPAFANEAQAEAAAKCMAYVAVVSGMDGKAEPDEATAAIVATFGNELMLQGSGTGKSEEDLQMTVVRHLVEMNGFVRSEKGGIPQLKRDVGPECERLLASLLPAE